MVYTSILFKPGILLITQPERMLNSKISNQGRQLLQSPGVVAPGRGVATG